MFAGELVLALDLTDPAGSANDTTQTDFDSGNFTPGSPQVTTTFVAPSAGMVWAIVGGGIRDNINEFRGVMSFEVRENDASGRVVYHPGISRAGWSNSSATGTYQYGGRMVPVRRLTPGQTYFARVLMLVNSENPPGHTVDFFNQQIFIIGG